MIADLRGYTRYTVEHGDEAAAAARDGVRGDRPSRRRGARGTPDRAARRRGARRLRLGATGVALGARAARRQGAGLPLGIGVGLDAGEAIPVGEGYRGGALNLAARLCSLAGPGRGAGDGDRAPARARRRRRQVRRAARRAREGLRRAGDGGRDPAGGPARQAVDGSAAEARRAAGGPPAERADRRGLGPRGRQSLRPSSWASAGSAGAATDRAEVARASSVPPDSVEAQLPLGSVGEAHLGVGYSLVRELRRQDRRAHRPAHAQARRLTSCPSRTGSPAWRSGSAAVWVVDGTKPPPPSDRPAGTRRSRRSGCPPTQGQIDYTAPTQAAVGARLGLGGAGEQGHSASTRRACAWSRRSTSRTPTCSPSATATSGSGGATSRRSARSTRRSTRSCGR